LKINKACDCLQGWLHSFKLRHGIWKLSVSGEKLSAISDVAWKFVEEFTKLISDENLTAEQIYNTDETGLFWRCLPQRTLTAGDEDKAFGVKVSEESLTILACTNAAGTHKLKLTVIDKSARLRALKGVNNFSLHYHAGWK
jgi:hypothetical protein